MARELSPHDAEAVAELLRLVDEVVEHHETRVFRGLVALSPVEEAESPADDRTDAGDPLWRLTGLVDTGGPGDVAQNVDRYLADAYDPDGR
jgi:hypothetical protein